MSPPVSATEAHTADLVRHRENGDWAAVVARHTRDDWPPPAWLAYDLPAESGEGPFEALGP